MKAISQKSLSSKSRNRILCSVCIATYQRPMLLEKLLNSLWNQVLPDGVYMEIVVVDNDFRKSALPVISKFNNTPKICTHYHNQPVKNISLTRNLAVKNTSGEYILFIDDDEVASPQWVSHLLRTIKKYDADGVFGLVVPEFHRDAPQWLRRREIYFSSMAATGTKAKCTFTTNCLIKASLIKKVKGPFDPRYGLTGGEDTLLFAKMLKKGARFVNCREAVTMEYIPPNRTKLSYIFNRAMQGGNSYARRVIETAGEKRIAKRLLMLFKGSIIIVISIIFFIINFPYKTGRTLWMIKLASNIGRFLAVFNWYYEAYQ